MHCNDLQPDPAAAARSGTSAVGTSAEGCSPWQRPRVPSPLRRLCLCLVAAAPVPARAAPRDSPLPTAAWPLLLARSGHERRPIVAMFSLPGCPFCIAMRREHLAALHRTQDAAGVLVAEFGLSDASPIAGADGLTAAGLAKRLGIRQAPTVCFFGPDGSEIAERLTGYSTDFFGAYLDERIALSRRLLGAR